MRIVFDNIIYSLQQAGGISRYWSRLTHCIGEKSGSVSFIERKNSNLFARSRRASKGAKAFLPVGIVRYLPLFFFTPKTFIFHSSYYRFAVAKSVINVVTVYDFTYEYYRRGVGRLLHTWQKKAALNRADGIICISRHTKNDLLRFYPHIPQEKIRVIHLGGSEEFYPLPEGQKGLSGRLHPLQGKRYVIFIGDRGGYKNFSLAAETLRLLPEYELVIVGGGELSQSEHRLLRPLQGRVSHFDKVDAKELNSLYNSAFCLLYPSAYEGFGLPLLEAMRAACPFVALDRSSIPEVAKDAGVLVQDESAEAFAQALKRFEDSGYRKLSIQKGVRRAGEFSQQRCCEATRSFYEALWEERDI